MGSFKKRLLPLLLSLALLCACTAGTPDNSLSASPSEPAPSPVQSYVSPSPSPSEAVPSQVQPSTSPAPASDEPTLSEVQPDISPSPTAAAPEPTVSTAVPSSTPSPSAAPSPAVPSAPAAEDPVEVIVYVTKTGEKYHSAGCQYLRRSQIPISLEDAKASGYTPCSKCHPPR